MPNSDHLSKRVFVSLWILLAVLFVGRPLFADDPTVRFYPAGGAFEQKGREVVDKAKKMVDCKGSTALNEMIRYLDEQRPKNKSGNPIYVTVLQRTAAVAKATGVPAVTVPLPEFLSPDLKHPASDGTGASSNIKWCDDPAGYERPSKMDNWFRGIFGGEPPLIYDPESMLIHEMVHAYLAAKGILNETPLRDRKTGKTSRWGSMDDVPATKKQNDHRRNFGCPLITQYDGIDLTQHDPNVAESCGTKPTDPLSNDPLACPTGKVCLGEGAGSKEVGFGTCADEARPLTVKECPGLKDNFYKNIICWDAVIQGKRYAPPTPIYTCPCGHHICSPNTCTEVQWNDKNCGECGKKCGNGTRCVRGICKSSDC